MKAGIYRFSYTRMTILALDFRSGEILARYWLYLAKLSQMNQIEPKVVGSRWNLLHIGNRARLSRFGIAFWLRWNPGTLLAKTGKGKPDEPDFASGVFFVGGMTP